MNRKILALCSASTLAVAGFASASSYYQTNDFVSSNSGTASAQNDFVSDVQFGAYGTRNPTVTPAFNAGGVALEGKGYQDSSLALIDTTGGGATPYDSTGDGLYGDTDAVLNFTIVGPTNVVDFGMGTRIDGSSGNPFGHGATAPLTNNAYNTYPLYYCNYEGGTLTLMEQSGYSGGALPGTQLAQETGISLVGGSDAYTLEMITTGSSSPTVSVTLSQNGVVVGSISATGSAINNYYGGSSPDTQGEVGFYGGNNSSSTNSYGIEASSFSVDAPANTPEPSVMTLIGVAGSGLLMRRRRRSN